MKFATVLLGVLPALTGCVSYTRIVQKARPAGNLMDATLEQLAQQTNARYDAVQNMTAYVSVQVTTGGTHTGAEKVYTSLGGYIFIRKPEDLRVILKVPVAGSRAVDMVSDGKKWELYVPSKNLARTGTGEVTTPSSNALENLRPAIFFDSMLVKGTNSGQIGTLTSDTRIIPAADKKQDAIEESDYNLQFLEQPKGNQAHTLRIVHISRTNLLPYQQDVFDPQGNVVTRTFYSNYQKAGDIQFPMKIVITRPLDQLSLTITVTKLDLTQKLEDDQFDLKIPDGVPVEQMK